MGRMGKRGRPGGYLDEDGYNDKQMQSQDRDERMAAGRGRGRGSGGGGRGGGGTAGGGKGPQISFTKHVPKFLQAHSKMLAGSEEQHELMDAAEAHTAKRAREGEDSEEEEMRERHEAMQGTCHEHPEMREHILAEIAKEKGNREFQRKNYAAAIEHFTTAVDLEPLNAVYLSNRSGAHCAAGQYEHALRDGKKCVSLKPEWAKGHVRCGAALHGMEDYEGAIMAFQKALDMDPDDAVAKSSLSKAQKALKKLSSEGGLRFRSKEERGAGGRSAEGGKGAVGEDKAVRNRVLLSFGDED